MSVCLIHYSKGFLENYPPSRIQVFVYSSLNHLMEKAGVGRGREILTENQSEMKMNALQGVPVGQSRNGI